MSVVNLSGKTVQWILRSTNSMRTAFALLPSGTNALEQKRAVSWYLGKEEHKNYLAQASYFYANPEYSQWKEKPYRDGNYCSIDMSPMIVSVC
jgi:hypothetical protein